MKLSYPLSIKLNITKRCNLRCKHCFINNYTLRIPKDKLYSLIDDFIEHKLGSLCITGGEPLLYDGIFEVMKYVTSNNIHLMLATNGTLIDEKIADKLKDTNVNSIQFSLDGYNSVEHDFIRGKGTFNKTIKAIQLLLDSNIKIIIASVIHKKNYDNIQKYLELCSTIGVKNVRFELYLPFSESDELTLDKLDIFRTYLNIKKMEKIYPDITIFYPVFDSKYACGAAVFNAVINPDLTMSPCDLLSEVIISDKITYDNSIKNIWNNSKVFKDWRNASINVVNNNCGSCFNKERCGYGCRAASYTYKNTLLEDDPICMTKYIEKRE